jgi:hypothetical protein
MTSMQAEPQLPFEETTFGRRSLSSRLPTASFGPGPDRDLKGNVKAFRLALARLASAASREELAAAGLELRRVLGEVGGADVVACAMLGGGFCLRSREDDLAAGLEGADLFAGETGRTVGGSLRPGLSPG